MCETDFETSIYRRDYLKKKFQSPRKKNSNKVLQDVYIHVCMCVFLIVATPLNLQLWNFGIISIPQGTIEKRFSQIFEKLFFYRVIALFLYSFKISL